jgi:hypothetical protein
MKHVNASTNEIVGNPKFQKDLDSGSKGDANKQPLDRPITPDELQNKTRGKSSMSLNTFQPWLKIT